ncbi:MAG: 30S ribosomal protein S20 [Pseudomonas fluorescens]|nr:MAG: 30S ribosomal protein S20 [Pseudomonas fluorescens]
MAHTNQQRKRIRQDSKRYATNSAGRSRVSTFVKKFEESLKAGDSAAVAATFKTAMSELSKAAQKGFIGRHAASRKISRLAARIKTAAK